MELDVACPLAKEHSRATCCWCRDPGGLPKATVLLRAAVLHAHGQGIQKERALA